MDTGLRVLRGFFFVLVVEFVEVLHVSEDDVLLVDDSWRNLLHSAGHLPQVGLPRDNKKDEKKLPRQQILTHLLSL